VRWQVKVLLALVFIFIIDQAIKLVFINGFRWDSSWLSLILVYNKGVAFSMFAFLQEYLKYLQLLLLGVVSYYFYKEKIFMTYPILSGILLGAGISNLFDRFIHSGVVDYVYYHGWFNFAVFNFADVMIDFSIGMMLLFYWKEKNEEDNYE